MSKKNKNRRQGRRDSRGSTTSGDVDRSSLLPGEGDDRIFKKRRAANVEKRAVGGAEACSGNGSSSGGATVKKKEAGARAVDGGEGGSGAPTILSDVIDWLESRKRPVPPALRKAESAELRWVLSLLPDLRERERRALARHVSKRARKTAAAGGAGPAELAGSDGEYDVGEKDRGGGDDSKRRRIELPEVRGGAWPADVEFSNDYRWCPSVPEEIRCKYVPAPTTESGECGSGSRGMRRGVRSRAARPSSRAYVQTITDPDHPACGQAGLFCAVPGGLSPGAWILDYVGSIVTGEAQDMTSDYVSDFGERSELALDANSYGNEARFLNDFRNTGRYPNVEFNLRRDVKGELRQGVYVQSKGPRTGEKRGEDGGGGKEPWRGVAQHEELLVSYGKSYWRSRVGNLTDFVTRLPGQPATTETPTSSKDAIAPTDPSS